MLTFCPTCANILVAEQSSSNVRLSCSVCPYIHAVKRKISERMYPKRKEEDDVLGGAEAWKNVDSTEEECPKCGHPRAFFMQIQTRSADEPMTTFYKCCSQQCGHQWKD